MILYIIDDHYQMQILWPHRCSCRSYKSRYGFRTGSQLICFFLYTENVGCCCFCFFVLFLFCFLWLFKVRHYTVVSNWLLGIFVYLYVGTYASHLYFDPLVLCVNLVFHRWWKGKIHLYKIIMHNLFKQCTQPTFLN